MRRKKYSRPMVESETAFEQTSLACTTTEPLPNFTGNAEVLSVKPIDLVTFLSVWECEQDVSKGGNFDEGCNVGAYSRMCIVPLS